MNAFPDGWVPIRIQWRDDGLSVDWCHLGEQRFREPFFDQTIDACLRSPFNQFFRHRTPISELAAALPGEAGIEPTGFIFHMSRCGSTLVAQMLAALPENIVISEASPVDAIIRSGEGRPEVSNELRIHWLRSLFSLLGRPRGGERRYFVKFDCWHVLELPLIRRAFPSVPWIFLYRDPVEVLVSQMKMPGVQVVRGIIGPALFKMDPAAAMKMPAAEYCARVLAAICQSAVSYFPLGGGLTVNYRDLPRALETSILPHFRVECSEAERAMMAEAASRDAKTPQLAFVPDRSAKARSATDEIRATAQRWLTPLIRELEVLGADSAV